MGIQHCHCRLCHSITITMQLLKTFLLLFSLIFAHSAADVQIQHVEDIETLIDIETVEADTEKEDFQDFWEVTEDAEIEETDSMENIDIDEENNYALDEEDTTIEEVKAEEESIDEEDETTEPEDLPEITENHETSDEIDFEFEEEEESEPTPEEIVKVIKEDIENEKKVGFFGRIARSISLFGSKN